MAHISFYLPCQPFWHEGIYQLETSDFATGYDPVLATDGAANRQWKELGDRTLFLKSLLESAHINGRHRLTAKDFAPDKRIPESMLKLDFGTGQLALKLSEIEAGCMHAWELLTLRSSQELSPAAILGRLLPFLREYYDSGADIDLLGVTAPLRDFTTSAILKEIAGDDSLDVESTRGIYPGNTYFLMDPDGGRLESATVLSVLTDKRIRFSSALSITRNSGLISAANIPPASNGAVIFRNFIWQSDWIESIADGRRRKLFIHCDPGHTKGRVFWQGRENIIWKEAELLSCDSFYDGTCDDVYILPGIPLRIRVEYPSSQDVWKIYWLALQAERELVFPETVKRPQIVSCELTGKSLTVNGNSYASLWDLPQGGFEMRLGAKDKFFIRPQVYGVRGESNGMRIILDEENLKYMPLTVAIRYSDIEGAYSRWSDTVVVENNSGEE